MCYNRHYLYFITRRTKMKALYAPWRHDYVNNDVKKHPVNLKNDCVFCHQFDQQDDEKYYIIKRFSNSAVILNFYPYNAGHIMIIPFEHQGDLSALSSHVRAELMEIVSISLPTIEKTLNAEGFNIGINLGAAGGGGIPHHLHIHVLPRWKGDTNFLEAFAETRLISSDMKKVYNMLRESFTHIVI
jgi:ATP adenylyltransferase